MRRRALSGALVAGLLLGLAPVGAAIAADPVAQTLDLGTVTTARTSGDTWIPTPVGTNTSPLTITLDPANAAGVCSMNGDGDGVDLDNPGSCTVHVQAPADATYAASNVVDVTFTIKDPQVLDLGSPTLARTSGDTWTPTPVGTNTSPLTITLDGANTAGTCALASGAVSFDGPGTCTVHVQAPADATRNASNTVDTTFTVKDPQTLDLGSPTLARVSSTSWTPTPVGPNTSPLTLTLDAGNTVGVCSLTGTQVDFLSHGTCLVHVQAPADSTRNASNVVDVSFTVKDSQSLDLGSPATSRDTGSTWVPVPVTTTTMPLDIDLDAGNAAGVCSLNDDGDGVDFDAPGTCLVHVVAPADSTHAMSNNVDVTFTVKDPQTLDLGSPTLARTSGTTWTPTPVATTTSPLTITLDGANTADACTLASGTVSFDGPGTCTVHVQAPADSTHHASNTVDVTFTVKDPQTLDLGTVTTSRATGTSWTPTPVGTTTSPLTITLDAGNTSGVCSLSSGAVSFNAPGTCLVHVQAPADATHDASNTVDVSFTVKHPQTPTVTVAAGTKYAGARVTPTVTTSYGAVTLVSLTTSTCTIDGSEVVLVKATTCTVQAQAAGDATHHPGNGQTSFTVTPRPVVLAVTTTTAGPFVYGDTVVVQAVATPTQPTSSTPLAGSGTITITAPESGDEVVSESYSFSTGSAPTVSFDADEVGDYGVAVTFTPDSAGTGVYATSSKSVDVEVGKAPQVITITDPAPAGTLYVGQTWTAPATNSVTANTPVLSVSTSSFCQVVGGGTGIKFLKTGTCTFKAERSATTHYLAGQDTASVTVALRPVTLEVAVTTADPADDVPRYAGAATLTLTARDDLSGTVVPVGGTGTVQVVGQDATPRAVTFTNGVATASWTPAAVGDHDVLVAFTPNAVSGTPTYATVAANPADPTETIEVEQAKQAITWGNGNTVPATGMVDTTWATGATGGASGQPVVLTSLTTSTCTVTGLTVTFVAATVAACRVEATQAGTTNYAATSRIAEVTVTTRPVDVTVAWPAGTHVYGVPVEVTVTATDRTSGTPVPDEDDDPAGTGIVSFGTETRPVTFHDGVGTVSFTPTDVRTYAVSSTFTATRTLAYTAATPTAVDLVITKAPQSIAIATPAPTSPTKNEIWRPGATGGGSGNAVTVSAGPNATCTDDTDAGGAYVEFKKHGACTITFTQAGNTYYLAGSRTVEIDVAKVGVLLTLDVPSASRTYGQQVVVSAAATSKKDGADVPGTVTITVTDLTPTTPVVIPADTTVVDPATGTATLTFAGGTLLAGTFDVEATFVPTVGDDFDEAGADDTVTVVRAPQTVTLTSAAAPTAGKVTDTWTPTFATPASGGTVGLEVRAAQSVPSAQPDYAGDPTYTPPATTCSVTSGVLRLDAQGSCRVDAVAPAVARKYDEGRVAIADVTVTRIPVDVTLTVTSPTAPVATGPVVGEEVQVRVTAKVDGKAMPGYGPLTVADPHGAALTDVPSATGSWFGGGRFYSFIPAVGGDTSSYAVATTFRPTDRVTYQTTTKQTTVQVDKAAQAIHLTQAQPTSVPVRDRWTPVATGGSSGKPITLGIDPSSSLRAGSSDYVCEVAGSEIVFEGHGTCVVTLSQAGTTDGYLPATLTTDPIEVYQTGVVVTLDVPDSAQVGVPTTITATATAGGLPVAGDGPLTIHAAGGALVESVDGTWTGGKQTLAFTPTHAGADMVVAADFTPADAAAYSDPALVDDLLTFATGVQTVAFTTGHDGNAWVGETWTPGPVATGSTTTPSVQLTAPTGACTLVTGVVRFVHAGTCTLGLDLAAVTGTYAAEDWSAAPHVEQTVVVAAHPTEVVLDEPVETDRRVSQDLTLVAQVVGHDSGNSSTELVEGTVQFTVDTVPYGAPVPVDVSGIATGTVQVVLDAGDEEVVEHVLGAVFTPTDAVYWAGDSATVEVDVERNDQNFVGDLVGPGSLKVGRSWTPAVTASSGGPVTVDVTDDSDAVCTVSGGTVTITASAPGDDVCTVLLDQVGDTVYAPIQVRPLITAALNPTALALTLPDAEVGHVATIQATVSAPGAVDPAPAGTVTFTVDGNPIATDVPVVGGTASASLTPGTAVDRTVVATFTPTLTTTYGPATLTRTLEVDPTPTETTVTGITTAGITAQVVPEEDADTALSGQVVFSYAATATPDATQVLGTGTLDAAGRASTTAMPPATQEVTVWATYAGDRDHASSDGTRRRGLPTITPTVDGTLTGWNTEPVSITFTCARDTAALATDCPGKVVRGADGKDQSVTVNVTARDGGRRTLTVSGIDIDRTGPVVGITGTAPGAWYTGSAPPASCSKARDALSGLASCTVKRVVGSGRTRTDVATATDKAGNTSVERVTYEVWDHWIAKAPLRGTSFQVKPGTTQRLVTITYGAKPQLMLPDAAGKLQPGPVFKASRIDEGVITWVVDLTVPKKVKAGSSYRFGFRLGGRAKVTKVTLDVVRRPSGQRASRTR